MTREVSNSDDVIDSRDVIARIEELQEERADLVEAATEATKTTGDSGGAALTDANGAVQEWDDDNGAELAALKALASEGEGFSDWDHGETLIRDSYFKDYAMELAADIGAVNSDASWPNNFIDWDAAADALRMDYSSVDFDGVTYWGRS